MAAPAAASSSSSSSSSSSASSRNRSAAPASSQQTASAQQAPAPAPAAGMRSGGERPPSSLRVAAGRRNKESCAYASGPEKCEADGREDEDGADGPLSRVLSGLMDTQAVFFCSYIVHSCNLRVCSCDCL
jgi:hypothetical protein